MAARMPSEPSRTHACDRVRERARVRDCAGRSPGDCARPARRTRSRHAHGAQQLHASSKRSLLGIVVYQLVSEELFETLVSTAMPAFGKWAGRECRGGACAELSKGPTAQTAQSPMPAQNPTPTHLSRAIVSTRLAGTISCCTGRRRGRECGRGRKQAVEVQAAPCSVPDHVVHGAGSQPAVASTIPLHTHILLPHLHGSEHSKIILAQISEHVHIELHAAGLVRDGRPGTLSPKLIRRMHWTDEILCNDKGSQRALAPGVKRLAWSQDCFHVAGHACPPAAGRRQDFKPVL